MGPIHLYSCQCKLVGFSLQSVVTQGHTGRTISLQPMPLCNSSLQRDAVEIYLYTLDTPE